VALHILRSIEETLIKNASHNLIVRTRMEVAFYILNQKRVHLQDLENRFGVTISIVADPSIAGTTTFAVDRGEPAVRVEHKAPATGVQIDAIAPVDEVPEVEDEIEESEEAPSAEQADAEEAQEGREEHGEGNGRRRRRRRRRRGRDREAFLGSPHTEGAPESDEEDSEEGEEGEESAEAEVSTEALPENLEGSDAGDHDRSGRRRRRGRRGGRGRDRENGAEAQHEMPVSADHPVAAPVAEEPAPRPAYQPLSEEPIATAMPPRTEEQPPEEPKPIIPEPEPVAVVLTPSDPDRPKRAGWWSKAKSVLSGS
jgi:ribonuclease E